MRQEASFLLFFIYLCVFTFLISCDNARMVPPKFEPPRDLTPGDISDRLVAHIYFDASLSMQGFVDPGSTRYTRMCPYLESVIVSGWTDGRADFFQFGERVKPIDRDAYLDVISVDFYENKNINRETFIQKIIDHEDQSVGNGMEVSNTPEELTEVVRSTEEVNQSKRENRLVVIVTDLFQDRSDINLLVNQLKEKIIKNDFEVGLFGIRSEFKGRVYDLGSIDPGSIKHESGPDPEKFRPFYLLVLGRHADIAHYFDRLKASGFPEAHTIIFSQYLVNPLLSIDGDSIEPKLVNLIGDTFKSVPPHVKQFRIRDNAKPASISAKLVYVPLQHAMFFDSDTFEVSILAKHAPMGETERSLEAQKGLNVTSTLLKNEEGNELTVDFKLDSQSLPRKTIYLYEVILRPGIDTYRAPEWCSDWDMGTVPDGSKTLNLVNFVRDLSQVTARMHHPKIAEFRCYIEKR